MVVRCRTCGSKDVDLTKTVNWRYEKTPRLYCSETCQLIGDRDKYNFWFWYSFILLLPILPLWIYYLSKLIKGYRLESQRDKLFEPAKSLCYSCGKELAKLVGKKNVCMHCGEIIHFCNLCQKHILYNEDVLQIEPCGHIFHKAELLEWTEEKKICPKCSVNIEFIDFNPE